MRRTLLLVSFLMLAGCDDKPKASTEPSATAKPPVASTSARSQPTTSGGSASAQDASTAVAASGKMAHCPASVVSAKTEVKDVENGIELTILAADAKATDEIRARVKAILDASKNHSGDKHTGGGAGGGTSGRCPIVLKNTTLETADVAGGSKVTVKAKDAKELDWLRRETRDRLEDLLKPGSEGAGKNKMLHCPSSVDGATTKVADTKDGVKITVTGADATTTSQIRERAKHSLDASKSDAGSMEHNGEGEHGGTLGRCPIVLTDTTLEVKDVTGGSEITVKAKKPADVAALQKEAKERALKFQVGTAPAASSAPPAASVPPPAPTKK